MLKEAGFVVQDGSLNFIKDSKSVTVPKKFKARKNAPATKLAYITDAEAKMLKKKKPGTPHKGPKGIPSYDSYGSIEDGRDVGMSGVATSAAEAGGGSGADRRELESYISRNQMTDVELPPGVTKQLPSDIQDYRSAFIAAGGGQRVNPRFFDSRDVVSPAELARAKAFNPKAFARTRGGGLLGFLTSGGILGNLIRGLGQRFGLGKRFDQPTYDMSRFSGLPLGGSAAFQNLDIRDKFDRTADDDEDDTNIILPKIKPEISSIPLSLSDTELQNRINIANQFDLPLDYSDSDLRARTIRAMTQPGFSMQLQKNDPNIPDDIEFLGGRKFIATPYDPYKVETTPFQEDVIEDQLGDIRNIMAADGGMIGGGIMDAAGRQQYFLGKLVKKAGRALKKIVKSPVGKLGLGALALKLGGGFAADGFLRKTLLPKLISGGKLTGLGQLGLGAAISAAPLLFQEEEEEQPTGFTGSVGGNIDPRAYTDPYGVLFSAFKAEGGSMKDEPVAKRTMPLLDMGGQEMDLRAEGGFVPIGRMEKADDVPARLSKNEFVFTADAVRNAGDGDVDKGAEVMYNMMKNLEAGGEVSEESQGLEGARNMFQTSKRLEEVL
jgi:hypothetical protein